MKRFIKIFTIMLLMVIGSNKVMAKDICASVNNQDVCTSSGEVSINGGSAKLEGTAGNYTLTLKNVDINDYKIGGNYNDEAYGIYFDEDNLTIKLEGNNKISFLNREESSVDEYDAIFVEELYDLNIIGTGVLNINLNGDYDLRGIKADLINLGEENKEGPTINGNIEGTSSIFISGDFNIYNTNIKGKIKGELASGIFSDMTNPCNIKNSDINLNISSASEGLGIFSYNKDLTIENSDILIKMSKYGDNVDNYGIICPEKITIKDSRTVIIIDENVDVKGSLFNNDNNGSIEFIHTNNKEFLFVTNSSMKTKNVTYNNIENTMVYVHSNSLEDIKLTSEYNISNVNELVGNYRYIVITTGISHKITSGNNQSIKKNSATSYTIGTNHFRYLVKEIKLNDIALDEEDYELTKDGKITFTTTGLSKLNDLDIGTYKVKIDYYAGDDLEVNLKIVNEIDNPNTMDNIILYMTISSISLISLAICILYKKKDIEV